MTRTLAIIIAVAASVLCTLSPSSFAQSGPPKPVYFSVIGQPGKILDMDTPYTSGNYTLVFQSTDGNLVVYRGAGRTAADAVWSAGTSGKGGRYAILQSDGNFVIYKNLSDHNSYVWNTQTGGVPRAGFTPYFGLSTEGRFGVRGYGGDFDSPKDPQYVGGGCTTATQYPVCIFPGTTTQWNSFVLACSPAEAMNVALQMGAAYGRCR